MIRIAALTTSALIALSLVSGPAFAQQKGGVQIAGNATVIGLANNAVNAATGNGSSTILCDCEAGLDRYVGPGGDESFATPDGRVHRATVPPELRTFASQRRRGDLVEVTFTDALAVSITE